MPDNPFLSKEEDTKWKTMYRDKLGDRVKFVARMDSQNEVADIISQCDLGVFPARAEGWNLDLTEVMAVTGNYPYHSLYSGHMEIYNRVLESDPEYQYDLEQAYDNIWFFGQGNWASLNIHDERHLLSLAIEGLTFNDGNRNKFSQEVLNKLSWENSVKAILENVL